MAKLRKISTKIIAIFIISLVIIFGFFAFIFSQIFDITGEINNKVPATIESISRDSELDALADKIKYYDEVLTQSARNYAYTGDKKWQQRYDESAPLLDSAIKDSITKGDQQDKDIFAGIENANSKLINLEEESMDFVDSGNKIAAQNVLENNQYLAQKEIYQQGLEKYYNKRGTQFHDTLKISTGSISEVVLDIQQDARTVLITIGVLMAFLIILLVALYILLMKVIIGRINRLRNLADEIAGGNLNERIKIVSDDEISQLSRSFNNMSEKLKESKENIEEKINKRTASLEKLNQFMVGRELKMIELKKEIRKLESGRGNNEQKSYNWAGKYLKAIDLEDKVIIDLENTYLKAIENSNLTTNKKDKATELIGRLISDSKKHKKKFEDLAREQNEN